MRTIDSAEGAAMAMPLGGIGTGNLAICADGALRQWQLANLGNHRGDLPSTFFALRVQRGEPPLGVTRVLAAPPATTTEPAPLVTDHLVPAWQRELLDRVGGARRTSFRSTYPVAELDYDLDLPVAVSMRAFTPMVPLDTDVSSIPTAMFEISLTNASATGVHVWLAASMQNPVGHDGASAPLGVHAPGYGGNTNRVQRREGWTRLVMESLGLVPTSAGAGQAVLTCDAARTVALPQWRELGELLDFLASRNPFGESARLDQAPQLADAHPGAVTPYTGASPAGATWNGTLAAPVPLGPGESRTVRFAITWHFPNRYVNFTQFGQPDPRWGPTQFWLGNHYATRYADAEAVADRVEREWRELERDTLAWTSMLTDSGLPPDAVEHLAAQAAVLRSPTCFRAADGAFYGFEGVNGASTVGHAGDIGGSCPLNCTHVWNYEHALATLFPDLEVSMRDTELDVMQAPNGAIPHRVVAPPYLPQMWDRPIGGPEQPALDGMLGTILKSYRELRSGAVDRSWLDRRWGSLQRLLDHVRRTWDPDGSGILSGIQPSTHDIDLHGLNSFMGTLWLAALRAMEEMARIRSEDGLAGELHELFRRGSRTYDEELFNGEYYRQKLDPGAPTTYQWGEGCLTDQLIGQWWAHELDLGHLLPEEHVRSALRAIVRHNLCTDFAARPHEQRAFADGADVGLLMCTWPTGGRPEVPTRYADEVWTGTEQQVAAHCLWEGLEEEGWAIMRGIWARYDGSRRNPYNHIECGDHYARSMSGWTLLNAWSRRRYDALTGVLGLRLPEPGERIPLVLGTGWGFAERDGDGVRLVPVVGDLRVSQVRASLVEAVPDGAGSGAGQG